MVNFEHKTSCIRPVYLIHALHCYKDYFRLGGTLSLSLCSVVNNRNLKSLKHFV